MKNIQSHELLLPNKMPMIKEEEKEEEEKEEKLGRDDQARILSVDDEPMNLLVLESLLKLNKIEGESCASGYRALNLVQNRI